MSEKQRALEALARAQWRLALGLVSLLAPERAAASGFAELQHRVHLGPEPEEA